MSHVVRISSLTRWFTVTAVRAELTSAIRVNLGQIGPAQTKYLAWETLRLDRDPSVLISFPVITVDRIQSPASHDVLPTHSPGADHTGGRATRGRAASPGWARVCRATCLITLRGTP